VSNFSPQGLFLVVKGLNFRPLEDSGIYPLQQFDSLLEESLLRLEEEIKKSKPGTWREDFQLWLPVVQCGYTHSEHTFVHMLYIDRLKLTYSYHWHTKSSPKKHDELLQDLLVLLGLLRALKLAGNCALVEIRWHHGGFIIFCQSIMNFHSFKQMWWNLSDPQTEIVTVASLKLHPEAWGQVWPDEHLIFCFVLSRGKNLTANVRKGGTWTAAAKNKGHCALIECHPNGWMVCQGMVWLYPDVLGK